MKLIAFTGSAGSGKSTAAEHLRKHRNFKQINFADPIKEGIAAIFGFPYHKLNDREFKEKDFGYGFSPRKAMQLLGTEWRLMLGVEDLWVQILADKVKATKFDDPGYDYEGVCIADLRYEYEADWVRKHGGIVVHIFRENNPYQLDTSHSSEKGIKNDPLDWTIRNEGKDLKDLEAIVENVLNKSLSEYHD